MNPPPGTHNFALTKDKSQVILHCKYCGITIGMKILPTVVEPTVLLKINDFKLCEGNPRTHEVLPKTTG